MRTCIAWIAAVAACWPAAAAAQTPAPYPAKALRIIVPLAPGGNVDLVVRALAELPGLDPPAVSGEPTIASLVNVSPPLVTASVTPSV